MSAPIVVIAAFSILSAVAGRAGLQVYRKIAEALTTDLDDEMTVQAIERIATLTDLMILAIIADGVIEPNEFERMKHALQDSANEMTHAEALERLQLRMHQWSTPAAYQLALDSMDERLGEEDRATGVLLIAELYQAGSRRAQGATYRSKRESAEAFLSPFARALRFDDSHIASFLERALRADAVIGESD